VNEFPYPSPNSQFEIDDVFSVHIYSIDCSIVRSGVGWDTSIFTSLVGPTFFVLSCPSTTTTHSIHRQRTILFFF